VGDGRGSAGSKVTAAQLILLEKQPLQTEACLNLDGHAQLKSFDASLTEAINNDGNRDDKADGWKLTNWPRARRDRPFSNGCAS
jgi:hypothetical protein